MALINRVSRLFKADMHAVLDRIEEPEQMLRQAIRDMEDDVSALERHLNLQRRERAILVSRKRDLLERISKSDRELDLCFENDKPALARSLVRQKLEAERLIAHIDSKIETLTDEVTDGAADLDRRRATLESTRQKAEVFAEHGADRDSYSSDSTATFREFVITDAEIDIAMLREAQRRGES
ncbi:MAG: PspA/IM30 family protein [Pseudomonadota bacterium]